MIQVWVQAWIQAVIQVWVQAWIQAVIQVWVQAWIQAWVQAWIQAVIQVWVQAQPMVRLLAQQVHGCCAGVEVSSPLRACPLSMYPGPGGGRAWGGVGWMRE